MLVGCHLGGNKALLLDSCEPNLGTIGQYRYDKCIIYVVPVQEVKVLLLRRQPDLYDSVSSLMCKENHMCDKQESKGKLLEVFTFSGAHKRP